MKTQVPEHLDLVLVDAYHLKSYFYSPDCYVSGYDAGWGSNDYTVDDQVVKKWTEAEVSWEHNRNNPNIAVKVKLYRDNNTDTLYKIPSLDKVNEKRK